MSTELDRKKIEHATTRCIQTLLKRADLRRVSVFVTPALVIKATRQRKLDKRDRQETYIITYGRPNFAERRFIGAALNANEPFPIKRVQFQFYPTKRKAA